MLDSNGEGVGIRNGSGIGAYHCYCVDSNIGCACCAIDEFHVCCVMGEPGRLAYWRTILLVSKGERRSEAIT